MTNTKRNFKTILNCIKYTVIFIIIALGLFLIWFLDDDRGYCLDSGFSHNDPDCIKYIDFKKYRQQE